MGGIRLALYRALKHAFRDRGGNALPRLNRVAYVKPPGPFSLPAGLFATIGVGIFFDAGGTPLEPTMVAILADAGTNVDGGYVFASIAKGMAAYSVGQTGSPFTKLLKFFRFDLYIPAYLLFGGEEVLFGGEHITFGLGPRYSVLFGGDGAVFDGDHVTF